VSSSEEIKDAVSYFAEVSQTLLTLPWGTIDSIAATLRRAYDEGKTVFLFGNGGSASLASHFACDLGKGMSIYGGERKRLRAIALTDNIATITAWANDFSYEEIFAEQLRNLIQPRDVAFAISCSGNSANVLRALEVARSYGAFTLGLGGFAGGMMKSLCDKALIVSSDNMQVIEDLHLSIAHCIFTLVRNSISANSIRRPAVAGY
jgi:D-sedoheptulose 7-phosphate isomerase